MKISIFNFLFQALNNFRWTLEVVRPYEKKASGEENVFFAFRTKRVLETIMRDRSGMTKKSKKKVNFSRGVRRPTDLEPNASVTDYWRQFPFSVSPFLYHFFFHFSQLRSNGKLSTLDH